jgi:hypothetical protein
LLRAAMVNVVFWRMKKKRFYSSDRHFIESGYPTFARNIYKRHFRGPSSSIRHTSRKCRVSIEACFSTNLRLQVVLDNDVFYRYSALIE